MNPYELDQLLRPLQHKDLRALCRVRGLNPGGSREQLADALKENMLATGNYSMVIPTGDEPAYGGGGGGYGGPPPSSDPYAYGTPQRNALGVSNNNYSRPGGQQNVGNFITDKPSSRVLAPPGGGSSISLGGYGGEASTGPTAYGSPARLPAQQQYGGTDSRGRSRESPSGMQQYSSNEYGGIGGIGVSNNNYSRPGGQQNVGNFITDKPSSRVLAPPGGGSSITFGNYTPPHQQPSAGRRNSFGSGSAAAGGGLIPASYGTPPLPPSGGGGGNAPPPGYYSTSGGPVAYPPGLDAGGFGAANLQLGDHLGGVPIPMGYDANFNPVHSREAQQQAMPGQRIPSAGRRAGKPPMPGHAGGSGVHSVLDDAQYGGTASVGGGRGNDFMTNNYSRPGGQQNVGNFITNRPSSRVLAPPGGRSQISFG